MFRHDPFYSFGMNTLYVASVLAIPVLIGCGRRERALMYVGLISLAVVLACNIEPLGRLLGKALPMSIFWRGRWMVPQLINVGTMAAVLFAAFAGVMPRRARGGAGWRLLAACLACGTFGVAVANTGSQRLRVGEAPANLTKFSDDMHELVSLLGGVEADPFVWSTFLPHHELPQLMPNIKLVMSRDKFMRRAEDEDFRDLVLTVFTGYSRGMFQTPWFDRLLELYPIDHVVVDRRYRTSPKLLIAYLKERGWERVGRTRRGIYEVWRVPGAQRAGD